MNLLSQGQRLSNGLLAIADPGRGSFDVIRANVPFRGREPAPCHLRPEGRWVRPGNSYRNGYSLSCWGHGQLSFLVFLIRATEIAVKAASGDLNILHLGKAFDELKPRGTKGNPFSCKSVRFPHDYLELLIEGVRRKSGLRKRAKEDAA